ncbi:MAG: 50S ribosomal protein L10 [Anaerolineaceae bacterium]|nr:50S ribosomal protein L10 [Anaerolineaceae bacterium]
MAITRERKEELVALYGDLLNNTNGFVVTEYRGMTVANVSELRAKLREVSGQYVITKNTLFMRALQDAGWPVPEELLVGPVGVAFGTENFPAVAKVVLEYLKTNEKLILKGGVMAGDIIDPKQVEAVSNLPSLDELRAQLAGLVVQPATGLVSVLNAATAQVVNVLQAYVKENGEGEAA